MYLDAGRVYLDIGEGEMRDAITNEDLLLGDT